MLLSYASGTLASRFLQARCSHYSDGGIHLDSDIERRHSLIKLDDSTLSHLVQKACPGARITSTALLTDGKINTNYQIDLERRESVVLRIFAREPELCRKEVNAQNLVRGRVPVPELLFADFDALHHERPFVVTQWVDGVSIEHLLANGQVEDVLAAAEAAGQTLAQIHSYPYEQSGFLNPDLGMAFVFDDPFEGFASYLCECVEGVAGERLGADLSHRLTAFVKQNQPDSDLVGRVYCLLHGDFNSTNVLFGVSGEGMAVKAVLDWEWAFAGPPLFDLANLLRYEEKLPPAFESSYLRGYVTGGGSIPPQWKQAVKWLDLVNLIGFMASPEPRPRLHALMSRLILRTLEEWESWRVE